MVKKKSKNLAVTKGIELRESTTVPGTVQHK